MVKKIKGWSNSDERQSTFWVDFSFNWQRINWTSSSCHSFKLTINCAGSGRWMLNVSRVASFHLNVKVVQELFRSKIRSTAADRRSEGAACYNLSRTSLPSKRRRNLSEKHCDRWGNLGLRIWLWDENTVLTKDIENFPRPKKAPQVLSNFKVLLIIFFGYKDVELVFKGRQVKKRFIWKS
jgi:hypothetical protein